MWGKEFEFIKKIWIYKIKEIIYIQTSEEIGGNNSDLKVVEKAEEEEEAEKTVSNNYVKALGFYEYFRCFDWICSINFMENWLSSAQWATKNRYSIRNIQMMVE